MKLCFCLLNLILALGTVGCGPRYVAPSRSLLQASIPQRIQPNPGLLGSLRVVVVGVTARPDTDEEEEDERKAFAKLKPGAKLEESDLVQEWRTGLVMALSAQGVQVLPTNGVALEFAVRRSRSADYICEVTVTPLVGRRWKKRYVFASSLGGPNSEDGPSWVVAGLLEDPEFYAAVQGRPLPPGTGIYLADAPAVPMVDAASQGNNSRVRLRVAATVQDSTNPSSAVPAEPAKGPNDKTSISVQRVLGWVSFGFGLGTVAAGGVVHASFAIHCAGSVCPSADEGRWTAARILYGAGAALTVGGLALVLTNPRQTSPMKHARAGDLRLALMPASVGTRTMSGAELNLQGSF